MCIKMYMGILLLLASVKTLQPTDAVVASISGFSDARPPFFLSPPLSVGPYVTHIVLSAFIDIIMVTSALSVCSITLLHLPQDPSTLSLYLVLISCLWKVLCVIGNIRTSRGAVLQLEIGQCSWWRHQGIRNLKWPGLAKKRLFSYESTRLPD